ncbi:MAG: serine hydrolase [Patescibacteria group bacterium]
MSLAKKLLIFLAIVFTTALLIAVFIPKENLLLKFNKKEKIVIIKKTDTEIPEITAESALVYFISNDGNYQENLFEKNHKEPHLIASVTKLMTALIAEENIDKNKEILITSEVTKDGGSSFLFGAGEKWSYDSLLHLMLIQSNNDAAEILATTFGYKDFLDKMNGKAFEIGLNDTHFVNPSGLEEGIGNIGTANDLAKLIFYIKNNHPNILEITLKDEYKARDVLNVKSIDATSTDLLLKSSSFPFRILGGKTGETPKAKKNLILLTEAPNKKGYLVFVVLKSEENFTDMAKLAHWTIDSFQFN